MAIVVERSADIGRHFGVLAFPQQLAGLHIDGIDWALLGSTGQSNPTPRDRRRNKTPVPNLLWIPSAPTPKLFTIGGVVTGKSIAPGHKKLKVSPVIGGPTQNRTRKGFERFGHGITRTIHLPALLSGRKIEGNKIGRNLFRSLRSA